MTRLHSRTGCSIVFTDEAREAECKDKDETFCISYVRIFANSNYKICEKEWFISDGGRYGCKKSCNLCNDVETATLEPQTCVDKDAQWCPSYVRIYGDRVCNQSWFTSADGRYGCKLSCNLC